MGIRFQRMWGGGRTFEFFFPRNLSPLVFFSWLRGWLLLKIYILLYPIHQELHLFWSVVAERVIGLDVCCHLCIEVLYNCTLLLNIQLCVLKEPRIVGKISQWENVKYWMRFNWKLSPYFSHSHKSFVIHEPSFLLTCVVLVYWLEQNLIFTSPFPILNFLFFRYFCFFVLVV